MQKPCDVCGKAYEAKRPASRFCSDTCRKRNQRAPVKSPPAPIVTAPPAVSDLVAETRATLEAAGRVQTPLGQLALVLAARVDSGHETGAAVAALSKELRAVMVDALDGVQARVNPVDELRLRRDGRRSAAG